MPRLRDLNLHEHLGDPARKAAFVTPMFDLIAPRYDDFTRLFSFGMDRVWKHALLEQALDAATELRDALDLACGTGDLAFAVASARAGTRVTGIDASTEMLVLARARAAEATLDNRVEFREGDLAALPAADAGTELVTCGYGFRNANLAPALAECARVLRPGGTLAVLDFYRPEPAFWRALFLGYLRAAGNLVGWWWHREPVAYGYIAHSIAAYVTIAEFTTAAQNAGFEIVVVKSYLGGGVATHILRRQ